MTHERYWIFIDIICCDHGAFLAQQDAERRLREGSPLRDKPSRCWLAPTFAPPAAALMHKYLQE